MKTAKVELVLSRNAAAALKTLLADHIDCFLPSECAGIARIHAQLRNGRSTLVLGADEAEALHGLLVGHLGCFRAGEWPLIEEALSLLERAGVRLRC